MQQPTTRRYLLAMLLGFIPDLFIGYVVARQTDSGWSGFFITVLALQGLYLLLWLKNAPWGWLMFWLYGRRRIADHLENFFIESHFPVPGEYTSDLDDYLNEIVNNEALDTKTRIKAAVELGTLNGYRNSGKLSVVLQVNIAARIAFKRYARLTDVARLVAREGTPI
jgi:hypothetical protein